MEPLKSQYSPVRSCFPRGERPFWNLLHTVIYVNFSRDHITQGCPVDIVELSTHKLLALWQVRVKSLVLRPKSHPCNWEQGSIHQTRLCTVYCKYFINMGSCAIYSSLQRARWDATVSPSSQSSRKGKVATMGVFNFPSGLLRCGIYLLIPS